MREINKAIIEVESLLHLRETDVVCKQSFGLLDVQVNAIKTLLDDCKKRYNVEAHTKVCPKCKQTFISKRSDTIYCADCRKQANYENWIYKVKTDPEYAKRRRESVRKSMQKSRRKKKVIE